MCAFVAAQRLPVRPQATQGAGRGPTLPHLVSVMVPCGGGARRRNRLDFFHHVHSALASIHSALANLNVFTMYLSPGATVFPDWRMAFNMSGISWAATDVRFAGWRLSDLDRELPPELATVADLAAQLLKTLLVAGAHWTTVVGKLAGAPEVPRVRADALEALLQRLKEVNILFARINPMIVGVLGCLPNGAGAAHRWPSEHETHRLRERLEQLQGIVTVLGSCAAAAVELPLDRAPSGEPPWRALANAVQT